MDIATIVGLVIGIACCIIGIISSGGVTAFGHFVDPASAIVTFGGAFGCMLTQAKSIPELGKCAKTISLAFKVPKADEVNVIENIIRLSNIARKEGLLALEEAANDVDDEFLKKGIMLIVDGTDPELVRSIMETELGAIDGRHQEKIQFWANLGSMGPAWGMIGTLMGLVNMLFNMDDMSKLGPNMGVAIITTFYGSILANWLCVPVSFKLKQNNALEITMKEIMVEGLLSIQAGENPRVIEEKLKSFLSPQIRENMGDGDGGAAEGGEA